MSLRINIIERVVVGKRYCEEVIIINFEKKLIPMTEEIYYIYEFELADGDEVFKCALNKKRNSLKGLIEGDYLKISFDVREKIGKNKYQIEKVRVITN